MATEDRAALIRDYINRTGRYAGIPKGSKVTAPVEGKRTEYRQRGGETSYDYGARKAREYGEKMRERNYPATAPARSRPKRDSKPTSTGGSSAPSRPAPARDVPQGPVRAGNYRGDYQPSGPTSMNRNGRVAPAPMERTYLPIFPQNDRGMPAFPGASDFQPPMAGPSPSAFGLEGGGPPPQYQPMTLEEIMALIEMANRAREGMYTERPAPWSRAW